LKRTGSGSAREERRLIPTTMAKQVRIASRARVGRYGEVARCTSCSRGSGRR